MRASSRIRTWRPSHPLRWMRWRGPFSRANAILQCRSIRRAPRWTGESGDSCPRNACALRQASTVSAGADFAVSGGIPAGVTAGHEHAAGRNKDCCGRQRKPFCATRRCARSLCRCITNTCVRASICRRCCSRSSRRCLPTWIVMRACGSACVARIPLRKAAENPEKAPCADLA